MQEAEMRFEIVIVCGGSCHCRPQDRVVVREEGEDNAQEETGCWLGEIGLVLLQSRGLFTVGIRGNW